MNGPTAPPRPVTAAAVLGLSIAVGLAAAAELVGDALEGLMASRRVVAVKGLAEREVEADLAVWPLVFTVSGNTLPELEGSLTQAGELIRRFLVGKGFKISELSVSTPRITDFRTQMPGLPTPPAERYAAESAVTLRTRNVAAAKAAMQQSGELVGQGVALVRSYDAQTQFMFTSLDALKPQMIAEATRDARRAARQFADDSRSRVGGIRTAQQGYFSISDRDPFSPERKIVRVVTTVEYFLAD
jgi:hypothetical protein